MNYYKYLLFFALAILSSSCATDDNATFPEFKLQTPDTFPDEDYELYSLFLEQYNTKTPVVFQKTIYEATFFSEPDAELDFEAELGNRFGDYESGLRQELTTVNQKAKFFDTKFTLENKEIYLITAAELDYINESSINTSNQQFDSFWNLYYQVHPDSQGYVSLSQIAYNESQDQALFSFWNNCGGLCGDCGFVYFRKESGIWTLVDVFIVVTA